MTNLMDRARGKALGLTLAGALVLAGCGTDDGDDGDQAAEPSASDTDPSSDDGAAAADLTDAEELTIGTISPLTGAGAGWGWAISGGAEFAADAINEGGGLELDGTTYRLVVERCDTEYTASGAVDCYNRLVEERGVQIVVGPLGSAGAIALRDRIEQDQLIAMVNSYTPEMLAGDPHYKFRIVPTSLEVAPAMWSWINDNYEEDVSTMAVVAPSDETGQSGAADSIAAAEQAGFEIVAEEYYERGAQDFSAVITRLLSNRPDVIDTATAPPQDTGLFMRQAREQGFQGTFVKTGGASLEDILAVSGPEAAEGLLMNDNTDYSNPEVEQYIADFEERYERPWNGMFAHFHDGVLMGLEALREAGTLDADAWVEAMTNIAPYDGRLVGEITWGGAETYGVDRQMEAGMYLYEVEGGELSPLGVLPVESP